MRITLLSLCFLLVISLVALSDFNPAADGSFQDYYAGQLSGKAVAKGNPVWVLGGLGCGVLGLIAAYVMPPEPPATAVLELQGKSPSYTLGFIDGYKQKARIENTKNAAVGWGIWLVIFFLYLNNGF